VASASSADPWREIRGLRWAPDFDRARMTEAPLLSIAQVAGELRIPAAHVRVLIRRHPEACTRMSRRVVYARRDRLADLLEDDGRHAEPHRQTRPGLRRGVDGQVPRPSLALAGQLRRRDRHAATTPDGGVSDERPSRCRLPPSAPPLPLPPLRPRAIRRSTVIRRPTATRSPRGRPSRSVPEKRPARCGRSRRRRRIRPRPAGRRRS
jgi:hypothetical protein